MKSSLQSNFYHKINIPKAIIWCWDAGWIWGVGPAVMRNLCVTTTRSMSFRVGLLSSMQSMGAGLSPDEKRTLSLLLWVRVERTGKRVLGSVGN